jgi:hypothetical protein
MRMQALKLLHEEWQASVVERLMHVKAACGMPLARRQRTAEELAQLRAGRPDLASQRIAIAAPSPRVELLPGPVITADLMHRAVAAAAAGCSLASIAAEADKPVWQPVCIAKSGLVSYCLAVCKDREHVPLPEAESYLTGS